MKLQPGWNEYLGGLARLTWDKSDAKWREANVSRARTSEVTVIGNVESSALFLCLGSRVEGTGEKGLRIFVETIDDVPLACDDALVSHETLMFKLKTASLAACSLDEPSRLLFTRPYSFFQLAYPPTPNARKNLGG